MKTEIIHNTTAEMPSSEVKPGEIIENVQICPVGDFPNGDHQQHCTVEALQNVVKDWTARGSKEILVDFEHNSESSEPNSDTSAAAWVSNVRVDPERGLVGDFKLTDVGAEAISNRRLRFLSVSWFVNKETHEPIRITSIALTNKPNIPVAPVLNKEGKIEEIENVTDANGPSHGEDGKFDGGNVSASTSAKMKRYEDAYRKDTPEMRKRKRSWATALGAKESLDMFDRIDKELNSGGNATTQNKKGDPAMDKIKEALGLAPEATEEDVLNAIAAMVKKNKDAEQAALEKEADDFAEQNSKKCNKEVLKAQYLANKEVAKAIVAGIPDAPAAPVCNKADAKAPSFASGADADAKVLEKYENMSPGKAKDEFLMDNAIVINRARNARDAAK